FVIDNRSLLEELNLEKTEFSLDDLEELYESAVDSVALGALLGCVRLKERVEEKRVPTKAFLEKTEKLRVREAEYKWMKLLAFTDEKTSVSEVESHGHYHGVLHGEHPDSYPADTGSSVASGSFGREMQTANRQLTVVLNVLLTVAATFVFGFVGLQYTHPDLSQEARLMIGLVMATVVLFADAYFL
ncbi:hypothetical protein PENTCL1PPCAC_13668, partial [Pristionchus entomophagus]